RLFVSTDQGDILCFAAKQEAEGVVHSRKVDESPFGDNAEFAHAAEEIVKQSKITEGYCVDLGCGDGALAYELAKRTKLQIVAIDADPKNVEAARKKLDAAGLYGS